MITGMTEPRRFKITAATASSFDISDFSNFSQPNLGSLGIPVSAVRPSLKRYFEGVLQQKDPTMTGSYHFNYHGDYERMIEFAKRFRTDLEAGRYGDPTYGFIPTELDNISKITLLTGTSGSAHVTTEPFVRRHSDLPESIPHVSAMILGKMDPLAKLSLTTARGTNHGWPTYVPGKSKYNSVDLIVHVRLGELLLNKFEGDVDALTSYIRENTGVQEPLSSTLFFRKMPMRKRTDHYRITTSGPMYDSSSFGMYSRERKVFGMPLFMNSAMREGAMKTKTAYKKFPNFDHTTPEATLRFMSHFPTFNWVYEDISNYDGSVSFDLQMSVAESLYSKFLSGPELNVYKRMQSMPILSPPLTTGHQGFLYRREGQTVSGSIWTDKDGTIFNIMRIVDCVVAATGRRLQDVVDGMNRWWTCLVFGDDCVIGYEELVPFNFPAYLDRSKELGFTTESARGAVFLMNALEPQTQSYHGILARALDKTFNKEYPVTHPAIGLFGDASRWIRLVKHPAWTEAISFLMSLGHYKDLGIRTPDQLFSSLTSSRVQKLLMDLSRDAQHSANVRDTLAGLTHGTMMLGDIANTSLKGSTLRGISALLAGLTVDEAMIASTLKESPIHDDDLFSFIRWSSTQVGAAPGDFDIHMNSFTD